jgi:catechol 2,3-dioxygenase-like lactoylglutathione lyase family enzyme
MVDFYRLLGVDIADPDPAWTAHHRSAKRDDGLDLDLDGQQFAQMWNRGWPAEATGTVLGFRVVERSTVDEIFARLVAAGHRAQQEPFDAFWGARYAVVADPDGNSVGIMSAIDPERRWPVEPPAG